MDATIVFDKIWKAVHSGSLVDAEGNLILDANGQEQRKIKYIILEGSSRSSKTHSLLQVFYLLGWKIVDGRLSVWRDTKKDCKDTVLNDMLRAYRTFPNYEQTIFNKTESFFLFPFGTTVEIQGTDDENKIMGFQGNFTWINEPYKISKGTFDQLDMRTKDVVFIDWNPKVSHWIDDIKKNERAIVIHSTFKDNPFCPAEQRVKILSYQPVKYSIVVLDGRLTEQAAKAYDIIKNPLLLSDKEIKELTRCKENERVNSASEFNWNVYGLGLKSERPNRIFKWTEISDDQYNAIASNIYIGVDWGAVDPMGIIEVKYYDGALYLKELNYLSENNIRERLSPTELAQIDSTEEGLVMWFFNKLGINKNSTIVCDNNRPLKIKALRRAGYDYSIAAVKGSGSIIDGIDLLNNLKVYFTSSSVNIKYEQENYSRQVDRYGIVLEEPEDIDNHTIDPARYVAEFLRSQGIIKTI